MSEVLRQECEPCQGEVGQCFRTGNVMVMARGQEAGVFARQEGAAQVQNTELYILWWSLGDLGEDGWGGLAGSWSGMWMS